MNMLPPPLATTIFPNLHQGNRSGRILNSLPARSFEIRGDDREGRLWGGSYRVLGAELGATCREMVSRHQAVLLPLPSALHLPVPCPCPCVLWPWPSTAAKPVARPASDSALQPPAPGQPHGTSAPAAPMGSPQAWASAFNKCHTH